MRKRIYRSNTEKVIGGVCGGLGEYFGIDPTWVRVLFVLSLFAEGVGLLAYLIGWIVIPKQSEVTTEATTAEGTMNSEHTASAQATQAAHKNRGAGFLPGIILVILGMVFLFDRVFYWFDFEYIWPLVIIGIGVILIYRATAPKAKTEMSATIVNGNAEVENGSR
jgi:phage shock protein PspC (stress-responsive transcriptional regulator)